MTPQLILYVAAFVLFVCAAANVRTGQLTAAGLACLAATLVF